MQGLGTLLLGLAPGKLRGLAWTAAKARETAMKVFMLIVREQRTDVKLTTDHGFYVKNLLDFPHFYQSWTLGSASNFLQLQMP